MHGIIPLALYVYLMVIFLTPNELPELNGCDVPYTDQEAIFESGDPRVQCHSDNPELCTELAITRGIYYVVSCTENFNFRFCWYGVTTNIHKGPVYYFHDTEPQQLVLTKRNVTLTDMILYCAPGEKDDIYLNVYIE